MISYILAFSATLIAAISQVILKKSANKTIKSSFIKKYLNVRVIVAYGLLFLSLCINQMAFRGIQLKIVPAISATGFIWILLFSKIFLNEEISKSKLIGTITIFVGVLISMIK